MTKNQFYDNIWDSRDFPSDMTIFWDSHDLMKNLCQTVKKKRKNEKSVFLGIRIGNTYISETAFTSEQPEQGWF